jgi:hypothetical protein
MLRRAAFAGNRDEPEGCLIMSGDSESRRLLLLGMRNVNEFAGQRTGCIPRRATSYFAKPGCDYRELTLGARWKRGAAGRRWCQHAVWSWRQYIRARRQIWTRRGGERGGRRRPSWLKQTKAVFGNRNYGRRIYYILTWVQTFRSWDRLQKWVYCPRIRQELCALRVFECSR